MIPRSRWLWAAAEVTAWYAAQARNLPWRRPDATAWAVVVSEFMLQQTPVTRVLPAYRRWLERSDPHLNRMSVSVVARLRKNISCNTRGWGKSAQFLPRGWHGARMR